MKVEIKIPPLGWVCTLDYETEVWSEFVYVQGRALKDYLENYKEVYVTITLDSNKLEGYVTKDTYAEFLYTFFRLSTFVLTLEEIEEVLNEDN